MKGFYISIKNELLEPKHYQNIGEAIWLYLWLLDKMTSISEEGVGLVSGGKPITTEDVQVELGLPIRTYRRYVEKLSRNGYIITKRTPHGLIFSVNKASKPFKRSAKSGTIDRTKMAHQKKKVIGQKVSSDVPQSVQRSAKSAHVYIDNNKTIQDNNNTTNVVEPSAPVYGSPEINDLFSYWEQCVGYKIEAQIKGNRYSASTLLKKYGPDKLHKLIEGVALAHQDKYAPRIADFRDLQSKLNQLLVWGNSRQASSTVDFIS